MRLIVWAAFLVPLILVAQEPAPHFDVRGYAVQGEPLLSTNAVDLSRHVGTNVTIAEIVSAASDLQFEYEVLGYTNVSVSVAPDHCTNGIIIMHVFRTPVPQILVSGKRYVTLRTPAEFVRTPQPGPGTNVPPSRISSAGTNAPAGQRTNAVIRFAVRAYEIQGDTLLTTNNLMSLLVKYTGTNMTRDDVVKAATDLQLEYRNRGFPTVKVILPRQQITNGVVRLQVIEGRLADITVSGNRYFSSNNVIRTLPSLHTNTILSGPIFQAELDRANANQDRQIYPELAPGPEPNTSDLILNVKDRFPLHGKIEFSNQSSPGTPELRLNSSAVYNNLWQLEHSIGVQYSFSPEGYKTGDDWIFLDRPLVANYSAFYRLPLAQPSSLSEAIATKPGTFGYSEAARRFELPPSSGAPELNLYASRSTIDTGVETLSTSTIADVPGVLSVQRTDVQQDLTVNNALGFRLSQPLPEFGKIRSTLSAGLDYKDYNLTSSKTNVFSFAITTINPDGTTNPPIVSTVSSPVPLTYKAVDYMPLSFRWDASRPDKYGMTAFGIGYTPNISGSLFGNTEDRFESLTGSEQGNGFFHIVNASLSRDQLVYKGWRLGLRADGQWANQPLINNEQFGVGGINSVRGYREGQVFGDTGWRISAEQKTPAHVVGLAYGKTPLIIRGSVYMDYGQALLLDPQGREGTTSLWGTGLGIAGSVGSHFDFRFLCSWPLLSVGAVSAGQPRFDFGISAQF